MTVWAGAAAAASAELAGVPAGRAGILGGVRLSSARRVASARLSAAFWRAICVELTFVAVALEPSCVVRRAAKAPATTAMPRASARRSACVRFMRPT